MKKKVNIYKYRNIDKINKNIKKVSVIIPNYNYEKFICERIDSIINQTYPIFELIILDDKSTDNSVKVIEEKIKKLPIKRIKFIKNEENSGCVFAQWQKGLSLIEGDFFWIAEADDSCEPTFLEKQMEAFNDKEVILSYCESARIDEKNYLIRSDSRDLTDFFYTGMWNKSFIMNGNEAIAKLLSFTNTILNVSSVVWKKKDYNRIFEDAKKYKVAGDWYIYYNVLKEGKLSYISESLNYYRKHSSSVTTNVKADLEFEEIMDIQKQINEFINPTREIIHKQNIRLSFMLDIISENNRKKLNDFKRKKIAVIFPYPVKGSGGHRTVIQNVNALISYGYIVDIYVQEDYVSTNAEMKRKIEEYYGKTAACVYVGLKQRARYDLIFATAWTTAEAVRNIDAPKKAYFIQDYEPLFEPMGFTYLVAENSYKYGFDFVTIGRWLSNKISKEFNRPARYFNFCADLNNYKVLNYVPKEDAVCFIYQPEKWRRCAKLGIGALELVKEKYPDLKIYLFGSEVEGELPFKAENLHVRPIEELCELYNRCKVGICISSSNPSRIPFEMMACGLPVVDLYRENNLYDMPDEGILLAESSKEALATAILKIYEDEKLQKKMSKFGAEYMKNFDLNVGFSQFVEAVSDILEDNYDMKEDIKPLYKKAAILPSLEMAFKPDENAPMFHTSNSSPVKKKLVRIKRKLVRIRRRIFRR